MKKKINSCLLLVFLAVFAISCSKSEDMEATDSFPETRADSPLLTASPTEVYFNDVRVQSFTTSRVNIKTAGLSSLAVLNRFDTTIQGPDAEQFILRRSSLSLTEILQALLGGGIDIPVTYNPNVPGPHEAELLITASLLGVLMPIQITVPLHGTTEEASIPKLLYTIPENRGTTVWEAKVTGTEYTDQGQYHVDFIFDQSIQIQYRDEISFLNATTARIVDIEFPNDSTLRLIIHEDILALDNIILIDSNAIVTEDAPLNSVGNERIILNYKVTGDLPDNEV